MTAAAVQPSASTQIILGTSRCLKRAAGSFGVLLLLMTALCAQTGKEDRPDDPQARVIDGVVNTTVFGMGQSIRITGTVKEGAMSFGGDVIVECTGVAAAIPEGLEMARRGGAYWPAASGLDRRRLPHHR